MAEVVVNIVVDQLISATTEWVANEISLIYGVEYELNNMSAKMQTIQKVMDDAENKSMKEDNIKQRLEKLQDISYDMEDVMDEWNTRVQKQKLEDGEENINASNEMSRSSSTSNFTCLSYKQFNCFSTTIKQVGWRRDIAMRIRAINQRMNMIFLEIEKLDLSSKVMGNNVINEAINTIDRTTTSSIEESQVHGRDVDKKYLLGKVLLQSGDEQNITHVIPIVGAGGLGKTTLAQLLYNDEKVKDKFDNRIWVCVSNPFDEVKVAHGILEGINVDHEKKTHLQTCCSMMLTDITKQIYQHPKPTSLISRC
ncbi:hypothetical protein LIER_35481 [Lithospermum erythrorhizon]|uniref:Uncharacterized protein n=1 Tax=Lithospermum erythrorhizon TaxID=34254 RepID=A0AAV3NSN7_LITER